MTEPGEPTDRLHKLAHEVAEDLPEVPHTPHRTSAKDLAFGEQRPSIVEAMGGTMGMIESGVPSIAFVAAITAGASTKLSSIIAVAVAILFAISRLMRRETLQFAITGIGGVAISAIIAGATGKAKAFFLPSFAINVGYGVVALVSVLARRPFVGYIAEGFSEIVEHTDDGEDGDAERPKPPSWRDDPAKMRIYTRASWLWVAIFFGRLIIEIPLYIANDLVALGTVKIVLSYPLFGVGVWLTWLMVRTAKPPAEASDTPIASANPAVPAEADAE